MELKESTKRVRRDIILWIAMIENSERYYFPKAIEIFYKLPLSHQRGLLTHVVEGIDNPKLKEILDKNDNTLYPDVIRSALFHYTGNSDFGEPSKKDFKGILAGYLKSKHFETAEGPDEGADDFMEDLEAI